VPRKVNPDYKSNKKKGVPPKKIDWDQVGKYLECQCPGTEIAAILNIGYNTLLDRCKQDLGMNFSDYADTKKSIGKALLRKAQQELALEKDRGMLIHLGQYVLDQTPNSKIQVDAAVIVQRVSYEPQPTTSQLADDPLAGTGAEAISATSMAVHGPGGQAGGDSVAS